ncbi:NUDIX domain-containing protein [Streptomyces sp. RPA4-5]|uniref:NUDIX hydrolase n=1 Tax=Streptomyces TaxID=1883 RepID=UPI00143E508A|nr:MULTISPECIES: NUDIX domain-containing protein [Streptomyces]MCX4637144.1 NUDIX domain-containing protein [Streptomyces platensis]QIY54102.1 NUDIX domain-containing protein [Streptomyces sp. RPA4-5]WJY36681.1 NUDIX domain-containing protein [Streptomyces sp. P9-2B-2]
MKQRVRAILITQDNTLLLMKRIRPGAAPYWVIIGGGVEDSDATREDALLREVREEIAGEAEISRLLHQLENPKGETEYFYLAHITQWNFDDKTGPEFQRDDRGEYLLDEIPLTTEALASVNLLPEEISDVLREALERGDLHTTV